MIRISLISLLVLLVATFAQPVSRQPVYLSYADAQPILGAMDELLPDELKGKAQSAQALVWPQWIATQDAQIRARIGRGDEDTMINFLLFGNSFTRQPRVTTSDLQGFKQTLETLGSHKVLIARIEDFLRGVAMPGANERLLFLRQLLQAKGTAAEPRKNYLLENLARVLREQESYRKTIEEARLQGGAQAEFIERSQLYRERGLSLDTSLKPNFAIEQSLAAMKARGLLAEGKVLRVAIIGPGLDFTDKAGGYDFYPEQTIQPFALLDSLLKLKLAKASEVRLTTFDLSSRVNAHLTRARARAKQGIAYTIQLPREANTQWKPELVRYWEQSGLQIGANAKPVTVPANIENLLLRAVRVRPQVVTQITPQDLNVVAQHLELAPAEKFDLIVATNILVYYDVLAQSLALKNIEYLLKPGGWLLSNNALLELPTSRLHSTEYLTVEYSQQDADGDHIVWYRYAPE